MLPIQDGHVFVIVTSETVLSIVGSSVGVDNMNEEVSLEPLMLPPVTGVELASE
jgi:hypothetical protein